MKIQSRPPVDFTPKFDKLEFECHLRNVMEITGSGTSDVYRKVLAEGAGSLLVQMGVIADFQTAFSARGYYGIVMEIRTLQGDPITLTI